MVVTLPCAVALARSVIPDCALRDIASIECWSNKVPPNVALQLDDEAVQDIRALLQGVRDEIESLHDTYLKVQCVRQPLSPKC